MNFEHIQSALYKVEPGLKKYISIMSQINETDVSKDTKFQKEYNGFYKMRQRKQEYYTEYFKYMEKHKNQEVSFNDVINHLYDKFGRIEACAEIQELSAVIQQLLSKDHYVARSEYLGTISRYQKVIEYFTVLDSSGMLEVF